MMQLEVLRKLLSSLDSKLTYLEKETKSHLSTIKSTATNIQSITSTCIAIQSQLRQKQLKEAQTTSRKTLPPSTSINNIKSSKYREKTPMKSRNSSSNQLSQLPTKDNLTIQSFIPKKNSRNPAQKTVPAFSFTQRKKALPSAKSHSCFQSSRAFNFVRNSKSSLTTKTTTDLGKVSSLKKNPFGLKKSKAKKLPNRSLDETNISKIISLDPKLLQCQEDPLLIGPISDLDFISSSIHVNNDKVGLVSNWINQCVVDDDFEDCLPFISEYLKKRDLVPLMLVSKGYAKQIKHILIKSIQKEKSYYESRLSYLDSSLVNKDGDIVDLAKFQFSKGALKAVSLLNDSMLNKLFIDNCLPSDDILLIYRIYFQLICHQLAQESNKAVFWEKCRKYFIDEFQGKIGNLIQNDLLKKTALTSENIAALLGVIKDNTEKITPSFFSKICGTTGLIVFFIKDVLDYIGISHEKKGKSLNQSEVRVTYKVINKLLEGKLQKLCLMGNYYTDHLFIN